MIASLHNPLVKHLIKLKENKKYREAKGAVLITGFKLIKELAERHPPRKIFVEKLEDALPCPEIYQVSYGIIKKITQLPSPEPIMAEFALPSCSDLKDKAPLLVLDAIQDPGNLGTLLRTALAFGWQGVFFLPGCVDPFNEKVMRASRGALFQLPFREGSWEEFLQLKEQNSLKAYIADIEGRAFHSIEPEKNSLLLLSNEAQGVSAKAKDLGETITIPMEGASESLNVSIAGAILMYYLKHGQI